MDWYKFRTAQWYRQTRNMTDAEKGAYMDKTVDALEDETEGVTPLADSMLAEASEYSQKQRDRRNGGAPRFTTVHHGAPRCTNTYERTYVPTDTPTHNTDRPTDRPTPRVRAGTGFEGSGESGPLAATVAKAIAPATAPEPSKGTAHTLANFQKDPVGYLPSVPSALLPNCAALYCQEGASDMAQNGYAKQMRRIGTDAFRNALDKFVRAGEAGEHAGLEKPGAALMAILKDIPGRIA